MDKILNDEEWAMISPDSRIRLAAYIHISESKDPVELARQLLLVCRDELGVGNPITVASAFLAYAEKSI